MATDTGIAKVHARQDVEPEGTIADHTEDREPVREKHLERTSKEATPVEEADAPGVAVLGRDLTVLAESDTLQGRMVITGDGRLLGIFSGDIECGGDLVIGPVAEITATIRGNNITIAGTVRGNIIAQGRLKLDSTGRLEGDARVGALVVSEGGVHHGVIRVHPEGVPDEPESMGTVVDETLAPSLGQTPVDRVRKFWGEFF